MSTPLFSFHFQLVHPFSTTGKCIVDEHHRPKPGPGKSACHCQSHGQNRAIEKSVSGSLNFLAKRRVYLSNENSVSDRINPIRLKEETEVARKSFGKCVYIYRDFVSVISRRFLSSGSELALA